MKGGGALKEMLLTFDEIWEQYIWNPILNFRVLDAIDILLLTAILYGVYLFLKSRRAGRLAIGLIVLVALYLISGWAGLHAIHQLMRGITPFSIVLIAVIFQPELRDALEKLGTSPLGIFGTGKEKNPDTANTVYEVVEAACQIAMSEKDGALIVIERTVPLGEYTATGHKLDAVVTHSLLRNIFVDRSPMHDGAVIIRNNRVAVAGSKLPLTTNDDAVKDCMGTRHRAAVGITEVSDCVVVVVSEERHTISIANNGTIDSDYNVGSADLRDEEMLKAIQNALRNDLFLLLVGAKYDESTDENGKSRKHNTRFNLRFNWSWGDRKKSKSAQTAELPEEIASESDSAERNG